MTHSRTYGYTYTGYSICFRDRSAPLPPPLALGALPRVPVETNSGTLWHISFCRYAAEASVAELFALIQALLVAPRASPSRPDSAWVRQCFLLNGMLQKKSPSDYLPSNRQLTANRLRIFPICCHKGFPIYPQKKTCPKKARKRATAAQADPQQPWHQKKRQSRK